MFDDTPSPTELEAASDADLVAAVAEVVRIPRREPASSFVLHAPLELAARAALLPRVAPSARRAARQRLIELATRFDRAGEPLDEPSPGDLRSARTAAARLRDAIDAGDLDDVDATATWLARVASPRELRALLADTLVPRLAAAAHAPIFLYLLPRVSPRGELTGELLRPLARELARHPDWRITWPERACWAAHSTDPVDAADLWSAIAATPRLGIPGSDFVYPIMAQVDCADVAGDLLGDVVGGVDARTAGRTILRAAARSMIDEPTHHAPYGWSHALTLPQAVLGVADDCRDPVVPVAVAATFLVGFRAALGATALRPDEPVPVPPESVTELVTYAATHTDAHLVKYTLACLDAAAWDRPRTGLYLSAAAHLGRCWRHQLAESTTA
jgi:hypothetical protein